MRFAIFGSGGLGGYYGARLAEAGHSVAFIARGAHLEAIKSKGLSIKSPLGDLLLDDVEATANPSDVGVVDCVLVAVKTWQVPEVAEAMRPMVGESTVVVPFLNGVDAADELAAVLGDRAVIGGLSKVFSFIEAPGVIRHMNANAYIEIGELDGAPSERVASLVDTLNKIGIESTESEHIRTALWKKLMLVASWSGVATLSRTPMGPIRENPATRQMIDDCISEGLAVGRAQGLELPDGVREEMWKFYDSLPPDTSSSMMRDMLEEKPSELDAWIGAIVKRGEEAGVPTPVSRDAWALLSLMEERVRASSA